jgi:glyoxylase-like metal-dependent hydrolase (beta-lactamase superfamily II)
MTKPIPLEDLFEDIIAKAMRGHHISESELHERSGVPRDVLARLLRGEFCDEGAVPKIAKELQLDPSALTLSASRSWSPRRHELEGLFGVDTRYRDLRVNAFLVYDPSAKVGALFDTGTDSSPLVAAVRERGVAIESIFLTHTHNDHVADLDRLKGAFPDAMVRVNEVESWPGAATFREGDVFEIGSLRIETRTCRGHSIGGTTYVIDGLAQPLAVVGDALFAGSMGGGIVSFAEAWKNNREKIFTLPDATILAPGHGPLTSVGEEKRYNPFFAGEFR